jgi:hypothetical protein
MIQLLWGFLEIVRMIFYVAAAIGVIAILLGSCAAFIILAAGFGQQFLKEHDRQ